MYNWIVGKIAERCGHLNLELAWEQTFVLPDGITLCPNLVIKHWDMVAVVDVTLPFDKDFLLQAAHAKVHKYLPTLPIVQSTLHAMSGEVIPVIVSARGALTFQSVTALQHLGLGDWKSLQTCTSTDIPQYYIDCVHLDFVPSCSSWILVAPSIGDLHLLNL